MKHDSYAWDDSFLTRIDPRVKIAAVVSLLIMNISSRTFIIPVAIAAVMATLMIAGRVPYRRQLLMISFPATFAVFAIASQTVFDGSEIFASLGAFDFHRDGFLNGVFISSRIIAGGLVLVMLGVSTPLNRMCLGLAWFRVPAVFIEVLQLTYRYLFDIHAEYGRMREAQRSRLGWSSAKAGLGSSRMLGGCLFMRVYERGARSADAMRCRGAGPLSGDTLTPAAPFDVALIVGTVTALLLLLFVDRLVLP